MITAIASTVATVASTAFDRTGTDANLDTPLDQVESKKSISDVVDPLDATRALPNKWSAKSEITQNQTGDLNEIITITHEPSGYSLSLEPNNTFEPKSQTTICEQRSPTSAKKEILTLSTLSQAIENAEQRIRTATANFETTRSEGIEQHCAATAATPTLA